MSAKGSLCGGLGPSRSHLSSTKRSDCSKLFLVPLRKLGLLCRVLGAQFLTENYYGNREDLQHSFGIIEKNKNNLLQRTLKRKKQNTFVFTTISAPEKVTIKLIDVRGAEGIFVSGMGRSGFGDFKLQRFKLQVQPSAIRRVLRAKV